MSFYPAMLEVAFDGGEMCPNKRDKVRVIGHTPRGMTSRVMSHSRDSRFTVAKPGKSAFVSNAPEL
jgi:hypothetical protein